MYVVLYMEYILISVSIMCTTITATHTSALCSVLFHHYQYSWYSQPRRSSQQYQRSVDVKLYVTLKIYIIFHLGIFLSSNHLRFQTMFVHRGALWHRLFHILTGGFCGITLLCTIFFSEKKLVTFVIAELRKRYDKPTQKKTN